jgi:tRNA modification GTPase
LILDAGEGITQADLDIYQNINRDRLIIFVNKEDLAIKRINAAELESLFSGVKLIRGSAKNDRGLEELEMAMEEMVLSGTLPGDGMDIMINLRQKDALIRSRSQIESALQNLRQVTADCLGVDIWGALETLGEISGKTLKEEVIDRIFHNFCIGK